MPLGINPLVDFAFKMTFGTPENCACLIDLLNATLRLKEPIVEVTLDNPFNPKDFQEDKLSLLDVKAIDGTGAIYDVEVQLTGYRGLRQRMVFYGCELYAGQLKAGQEYHTVNPVYTVWLIDGILWPDAAKVHHVFRLTDADSGRVLEDALEIHTLELGRYNVRESELASASLLDCWLFWLLHAPEYDPGSMAKLLPHAAIRQATETLTRIAQITENKTMYDARAKFLRDQKWERDAMFQDGKMEGEIKGKAEGKAEGKIEGEIRLVRILQGLAGVPVAEEQDLRVFKLEELQAMTNDLQVKLRGR
jgi:predicted transposase/invertase (TIGR01784 family)